jgi:hypothetical protein
MATATCDWSLGESALAAHEAWDGDAWQALERLALWDNTENARDDPRRLLEQLGLLTPAAHSGDRLGPGGPAGAGFDGTELAALALLSCGVEGCGE